MSNRMPSSVQCDSRGFEKDLVIDGPLVMHLVSDLINHKVVWFI